MLWPKPRPTPTLRCPRIGLGKTEKLASLEGGEAHHASDVCVCGCGCVSILVPTLKKLWGGFFLFPPEPK